MELKYEIYIGASPEQVWQALVSPEGTRQIFFGSALESTFEIGAPFQYVGPGNEGDRTVHVYGTILAYEENKMMVVREHPGPSYYPNHAELESTISFALDVVGATTKLTLINNQFTDNHPSVNKASDSWWIIISSLKTYVETGKTLDFGW
jgi:uncharacterized protein YndB with AHSA1/START domain